MNFQAETSAVKMTTTVPDSKLSDSQKSFIDLMNKPSICDRINTQFESNHPIITKIKDLDGNALITHVAIQLIKFHLDKINYLELVISQHLAFKNKIDGMQNLMEKSTEQNMQSELKLSKLIISQMDTSKPYELYDKVVALTLEKYENSNKDKTFARGQKIINILQNIKKSNGGVQSYVFRDTEIAFIKNMDLRNDKLNFLRFDKNKSYRVKHEEIVQKNHQPLIMLGILGIFLGVLYLHASNYILSSK